MTGPGLSSRRHSRDWGAGPTNWNRKPSWERQGDRHDDHSYDRTRTAYLPFTIDAPPASKRFRGQSDHYEVAARPLSAQPPIPRRVCDSRRGYTPNPPHSRPNSTRSEERPRDVQPSAQSNEIPSGAPSHRVQVDRAGSDDDGISAWISSLLDAVETRQMSQSFEYILQRFSQSDSTWQGDPTSTAASAQALARSREKRQSAIIDLVEKSAELLSTRPALISLQRQVDEQAQQLRSLQCTVRNFHQQQLRTPRDARHLAAIQQQVSTLSEACRSHGENLERHSVKIRWLQDQIPSVHRPLSDKQQQQQQCSSCSEDGEIQDEAGGVVRVMRDLLKEHLRDVEERFVLRNEAQHATSEMETIGGDLSTMQAAAEFLHQLQTLR